MEQTPSPSAEELREKAAKLRQMAFCVFNRDLARSLEEQSAQFEAEAELKSITGGESILRSTGSDPH